MVRGWGKRNNSPSDNPEDERYEIPKRDDNEIYEEVVREYRESLKNADYSDGDGRRIHWGWMITCIVLMGISIWSTTRVNIKSGRDNENYRKAKDSVNKVLRGESAISQLTLGHYATYCMLGETSKEFLSKSPDRDKIVGEIEEEYNDLSRINKKTNEQERRWAELKALIKTFKENESKKRDMKGKIICRGIKMFPNIRIK
ncbi:hypothetical protein H6G33_09920 [Calothrix sp. FACHB-1219]|uniref:hypothetical protein n=1 Tax=unclassified Calothrix TaxID=2619626 RepID=UPI0016833630|nr:MULTISPECIES: hypothetical protein [unclassified Calothrix]MBD2201663.1 hypothetical protein [Calothrix sp. FACHB-168]MBD2217349.1 hypothetical protein [Calothrix sp. FACHB-1219]